MPFTTADHVEVQQAKATALTRDTTNRCLEFRMIHHQLHILQIPNTECIQNHSIRVHCISLQDTSNRWCSLSVLKYTTSEWACFQVDLNEVIEKPFEQS